MTTTIDHIVLGAKTLEQGTAWFREQFGVEIPYGGYHKKMATHNHLAKLSDNLFIEIIAVDSQLPQPQRPRWYGLDDPYIQTTLSQTPKLLTWVVNTDDINLLLSQSNFNFGEVMELSRGSLKWDFSVPDDGRLLAGGIVPYVMQWKTNQHPAINMPELGLRFKNLNIFHSNSPWIESILKSIGADTVSLEKLPSNMRPYIELEIDAPSGTVILAS